MSPCGVHESLTEVEKKLDFCRVAVYFSLTHKCAPWLPAIEPPLWTLFISAAEPTPTTPLAVSFEEYQAATVDPILVLPLQDPREFRLHKEIKAS